MPPAIRMAILRRPAHIKIKKVGRSLIILLWLIISMTIWLAEAEIGCFLSAAIISIPIPSIGIMIGIAIVIVPRVSIMVSITIIISPVSMIPRRRIVVPVVAASLDDITLGLLHIAPRRVLIIFLFFLILALDLPLSLSLDPRCIVAIRIAVLHLIWQLGT